MNDEDHPERGCEKTGEQAREELIVPSHAREQTAESKLSLRSDPGCWLSRLAASNLAFQHAVAKTFFSYVNGFRVGT